MNEDLKVRISDVNLEVVDINGFKYNLHMVEYGNKKTIKTLIPIFSEVEIGDCIETNNWTLTQLGSKKPADLCIRIDSFDIVTDTKDFTVSKHLNCRVQGMFLNSDKCYLRTVGPDAKPFYMATLKIKDSLGLAYENIFIGFNNMAKKLSTIKKKSIIDCVVTVREKKDGKGYELACITIYSIKEIE